MSAHLPKRAGKQPVYCDRHVRDAGRGGYRGHRPGHRFPVGGADGEHVGGGADGAGVSVGLAWFAPGELGDEFGDADEQDKPMPSFLDSTAWFPCGREGTKRVTKVGLKGASRIPPVERQQCRGHVWNDE